MQYPKLIIHNHELELAEQQSDIEDFIYAINEHSKGSVMLLDKTAGYSDLAGNTVAPLSELALANLVKEYLANEGQCCLSKITQLTPEQAFALIVN